MVNDYFCRLELCWNIARRRMRFDFLVQHLLVSKSNFTQRPFLVVNQDPNILLTGRSLLGARDNESWRYKHPPASSMSRLRAAFRASWRRIFFLCIHTGALMSSFWCSNYFLAFLTIGMILRYLAERIFVRAKGHHECEAEQLGPRSWPCSFLRLSRVNFVYWRLCEEDALPNRFIVSTTIEHSRFKQRWNSSLHSVRTLITRDESFLDAKSWNNTSRTWQKGIAHCKRPFL